MLLKNRKQKTLIIMAIAVIAIVALIANKKEVEIQIRNLAEMQVNYATAEVTTYDVSEAGDGSVTATLSEDGVLTISGTGAMKNWSVVNYIPWWSARKEIKQVKIEAGVTSVGVNAFYNCSNLTSVEIANSVTSIESGAFQQCGCLIKIEIPSNVTSIGSRAFYDCTYLSEINIPSSVNNIGNGIFSNCVSLQNISVDSNNANYCDENGILFSKDKTKIIAYPAGKIQTEYVIPNGVTSIEEDAFDCCYNLIEIKIPGTVTIIGNSAFSNCVGLTDIEIPSSVIEIGSYAFYSCDNLQSIEIPNGVISIGYNAFYACNNLVEIYISNTVTSIGNSAFLACGSLVNINVSEGNTNYCDVDGVIYTKDKTKIIAYPAGKTESKYAILNGVINIESNSFNNCDHLTEVDIPTTVTKIGDYAFSACGNLTEIEIPENVTSIGDGTFSGCGNLTEIEIPENVTSIGDWAFSNCKNLTKIEIPSSVSMGSRAFNGSEVLKLVEKGNNMIDLPYILKRAQNEEDILYSSTGFTLTNCTIENEQVKINDGKTYAEIYVKKGSLYGLTYIISYNEWDISETGDGSVTAILSEDGILTISGTGKMKNWESDSDVAWYAIIDRITQVKIETGVTNIGSNAFYNCSNLTSIEIPNSITSIGSSAFYNCNSLSEIDIPSSVDSIGTNIFSWCESLQNIRVEGSNTNYCDENGVLYTKDKTKIIAYPAGKTETEYTILDGVTTIGTCAFNECYNLQRIEMPDSVTTIEEYAFEECWGLREIEIPNSVISIGDFAFYYCESLKNIKIQDGIESIGIGTFFGCMSLEKIEIPNSVISIGEGAFWYCPNLKEVEIGRGVTTIDAYAFGECTSLTEIAIPSSVTNIGEYALWETLTIYCFEGSAAETYAIDNEIPYEIISLTSTKVEIDHTNLIIKGINPETIIKELKAAIESNLEYQIIDLDGNVIEDETALVGTGYKLKLEGGLSYIIAVKGDLNGDGKIKLSDISIVNKYRLNKTTLEEIYLLAGDVTGDGEVSFRDMTKMNRYRLHKITEL